MPPSGLPNVAYGAASLATPLMFSKPFIATTRELYQLLSTLIFTPSGYYDAHYSRRYLHTSGYIAIDTSRMPPLRLILYIPFDGH